MIMLQIVFDELPGVKALMTVAVPYDKPGKYDAE